LKKIKICSNWDSSENLTNRLLKQFKTDELSLENTIFVYDESYDIIVYFNHITEKKTENSHSYIFPHEPSWSGSHQKNIPDDTFIFGFNSQNYNQNCIESLAYTFYGGRGPWIDTFDYWSYDSLKKIEPKKTKKISSSITKLDFNYGNSCLYNRRVNLLNNILNLDYIDFYGFGNTSPKKRDAVENYMFNIAIENSFEKNWLTEKFYDAILSETIPIYFGCENIKEIYPDDGYILIEDICDYTNIKKVLDTISKNYEDIYNEKIIGLKKIKQKYFNQNNLLQKIISL
jgi:hypothetical protein